MSRRTRVARRRVGWFTRLRAILAGMLVLGVGSTLTLAAWTDTEYASGSFGASRFVVESQTAASAWASHDAGNPATLQFAATAMSPGTSFYAYIDIRTTTATTVPGTVALAAVTNDAGALVPALQYRVVSTANTVTCAAAAFAAQTYVDATVLPASPPSATLLAAAGDTKRFCFDVRIKVGTASTFQGAIATLTWRFDAISNF